MNIDLTKIPAVYMNLKQHVEKNENMKNILKNCGFEKIIRVEGVYRPDNTIAGCSSAHYKGLCEIDPPFILFEDDCIIKNFKSEIEIPDDADAVYLGISSWGRMNGHSGPCVQYKNVTDNLHRIYNMLGGHSILYIGEEYVEMCKRICYHAGYVTGDYQDIGFAEIQKWFNIYAFDDPFFYQTSSNGTDQKLSSYPTIEIFQQTKQFWKPTALY